MTIQTGTTRNFEHAGVWRRLMSGILDSIFLILMFFILFLAAGFVAAYLGFDVSSDNTALIRGNIVYVSAMFIFFSFNYFFLQVRSSKQATFGMRMAKIKLTDTNYHKPKVKRIMVMCLAMFSVDLISLLLVVCGLFSEETFLSISNIDNIDIIVVLIMIHFTKKKQAYWDMIAGTYVIKNPKKTVDTASSS